jgi:hypothetical protein
MTEDEAQAICHGISPFSTWNDWRGRVVTKDGTDTTMPTADDVAEVLHEGTTDEGDWDGTVAGIVRLHDGRFVAWETFWGPTGDGFHEDAYGGDADVTFAATLDGAIRWGLTNEGRALCGLSTYEDNDA